MRDFLRWLGCGFSGYKRRMLVYFLLRKWGRRPMPKRWVWNLFILVFLVTLELYSTYAYPQTGGLLVTMPVLALEIMAGVWFSYISVRYNRRKWPPYMRYAHYRRITAGAARELKQLWQLDVCDVSGPPSRKKRMQLRLQLLAAATAAALFIWLLVYALDPATPLSPNLPDLLALIAVLLGFRIWRRLRIHKQYRRLGFEHALARIVRQAQQRFPDQERAGMLRKAVGDALEL